MSLKKNLKTVCFDRITDPVAGVGVLRPGLRQVVGRGQMGSRRFSPAHVSTPMAPPPLISPWKKTMNSVWTGGPTPNTAASVPRMAITCPGTPARRSPSLALPRWTRRPPAQCGAGRACGITPTRISSGLAAFIPPNASFPAWSGTCPAMSIAASAWWGKTPRPSAPSSTSLTPPTTISWVIS